MNEAIRELGQQLDSKDAYERETSALELAELEDPQTAPLLTRALEDEEASVRRWGAYGLAKLGRPEHAQALRRAWEKDANPRVRVQAAAGLARLGEKAALEKLPQYLSAPSLDVRRDAAEVLFALPGPPPLRTLLKPLLSAKNEPARAWAAAMLHTLGEAEAFARWRGALASPEGRVDAVLSAPLMREPRAARELLRLLVELSQEELEATEQDVTIQEMLGKALQLSGLDTLLGGAEADEELRADLLTLLGRHPHLVPELTEELIEFLSQSPPEKLGRELAQLLSAQEREERASIFAVLAPLFPQAAPSTLIEMKGAEREEALQAVARAAAEAAGQDPRLVELTEKLRATPYRHHFEGLPTGPQPRKAKRPRADTSAVRTIEEMPAITTATVTREMEIPLVDPLTRTPTQELELPTVGLAGSREEGEEEWDPTIPPEPAAVAQRALVIGGLLRRLALEERLARAKDAAAREELLRIQRWMEEEGLFATVGVTGLELLESEPGSWSEEDRQSISWNAEELHLLLWALKQGKLPPLEARVEAAPLLERLPLLKDPQPFLESAELRFGEEIEAQRDRWEVLLECARYESLARGIAADPSIAEGDPDLELLLESAEEVGFDRRGTAAKHGKARAAAEGLRHWSRHRVTQLQEEGLLPGKPGEGLVLQGKRLQELSDDALATLLALAHGRFQALEWLAAGDVILPEGEDEAG